jgi:hypothetical protein
MQAMISSAIAIRVSGEVAKSKMMLVICPSPFDGGRVG